MPDARRALLDHLIDHAPLFPPASMSVPDAAMEDRRRREDSHAWMLGCFVCPVSTLGALREAMPWWGGARAQRRAEQVVLVIASCRQAGVTFKATAGLHQPLRPVEPGSGVAMRGFLNLLAAAVLAHAQGARPPRLGRVLGTEDRARSWSARTASRRRA